MYKATLCREMSSIWFSVIKQYNSVNRIIVTILHQCIKIVTYLFYATHANSLANEYYELVDVSTDICKLIINRICLSVYSDKVICTARTKSRERQDFETDETFK